MAVGAIIEDGSGRFLLVKHRPERGGFWQKRWIFPGGKLETGESIADGTMREIMEETNLDISLTRQNPLAERVITSGRSVSLHVLYVTHMAKIVGGELNPASDVGEAQWFTREQLSESWEELHEDTRTITKLAMII